MPASAPPASPLPALRPLRRDELPADAVGLARYLLDKVLVHDLPEGRLAGRIVETEAYPVGDPASYAYRGRTRANGAMFLAPGHAHVRLLYGLSWTLNISAEAEGIGAGILVRALEPLAGLEAMRQRRPAARPLDLARGPGRLGAAMAIGPGLDRADLCTGAGLWLADRATAASDSGTVGVARRIGLSRAADLPLRFFVADNPYVSGPRAALREAQGQA